MGKSYYEKLKDPRWQRKRLEILERDGFACAVCGSNTSTLHVHHGFYRRNVEPWDYPSKSLHTLCEECHEATEELLDDIRGLIGVLNFEHLVALSGVLMTTEDIRNRLVSPDNFGASVSIKADLAILAGASPEDPLGSEFVDGLEGSAR